MVSRAFDQRSGHRRAHRHQRAQSAVLDRLLWIDAQHPQGFLAPGYVCFGLGQIAFGLLIRNSGGRLVLKQILVHVVGLLGEIQIALALQVIRDQRGDLAAFDRKQQLIFFDGITDTELEIDRLTWQGSQDASRAIVVELHFAGAGELAPPGFKADRFHVNVREHGRIEFDVVGNLRLRGSNVRGVRPARGRFASRGFLASYDSQQRGGENRAQHHLAFHGITSSPTTDARRLMARR